MVSFPRSDAVLLKYHRLVFTRLTLSAHRQKTSVDETGFFSRQIFSSGIHKPFERFCFKPTNSEVSLDEILPFLPS